MPVQIVQILIVDVHSTVQSVFGGNELGDLENSETVDDLYDEVDGDGIDTTETIVQEIHKQTVHNEKVAAMNSSNNLTMTKSRSIPINESSVQLKFT